MDVPYLMHVPDGDKLWLIDGEQCLCITPRIYDLLIKHGADLPPAYGIEELREQNAKLREYVTKLEQENIVLTSNNCDLLNDMAPMQEWNDRLRKLVQRMWPVFIGEKRAIFADRLHVRAEIDELWVDV